MYNVHFADLSKIVRFLYSENELNVLVWWLGLFLLEHVLHRHKNLRSCYRYLGGAFDVETLVENLLRQMAGSQIIAVNVYDITNETMPLVMYGHTNVEKSKNTYVSSLDFGDPARRHEMRCRCGFIPCSNLQYLAMWLSLNT